MPHPFSRYSSLTDLAKLQEASALPLRKSMRVNTLKCSVEEFVSWARKQGWQIDPVPWCPEGFFVDREDRSEALGKDLLHVLGSTYMQEAASMLPVVLLDPQPGEVVLDMSSAPGSKSTQIAARMQGRGVLVCNDVQEKRLWSLLSNLQRCGVTNAVVTRKVGQWFGNAMTERFDRVLCDAPCTAQGTVRKDSDALRYCSLENTEKMARLQASLLEAAVHACKVGGRIVYSTCTLTPEENEGVVLSVLNKYCDQLSLLHPKEIFGCDVTRAIADSQQVSATLGRESEHPMIRLWPQTYDTEGFFSAVLQKSASTKDPARDRDAPHRYDLVPPARMREASLRLTDWFGSSFLDPDEVLLQSKEQLLLTTRDVVECPLPTRPYYVGLPFAKPTDHGLPRLSHEMATLRGHTATKQMVHLLSSTMKEALSGVNVSANVEGIDDGDVLLGFAENVLMRPMIFGRGLLKKGAILNRLPREIVRMFS